MKKAQVILEKAENNYSAYITEFEGCIATGSTIQDTKENVYDAVAFHLEGMKNEQLEIPDTFKGEFDFEFKIDVASLFEWFSGILTKSGLARLTGMNQSLISQYANGIKKPSTKQTAKIQEAIHGFGEELLEVQL
ncbi:MAG TPA: type II toxin-antitoxin system HicB family antitoxin [Bacteroides sp.]|nr:type II toxin-antitoxin system HicB family antitoxin [Bacteroides sp.]